MYIIAHWNGHGSRVGSGLHVMLFLVCFIERLCIFNGLRSGICPRALLGYHYRHVLGGPSRMFQRWIRGETVCDDCDAVEEHSGGHTHDGRHV
jgi:hypothetical protein